MKSTLHRFLVVIMSFFMVHEHALAAVSKEELFQTSPFILAKVSPDGTKIAYVGADEKGIANVFIKEEGKA